MSTYKILVLKNLANESTLGEETLANLMLTLSKLAVRNEFCQEISDKGGLAFVLKCLDEKHLANMQLLKSALSLLKSICNNDLVRMVSLNRAPCKSSEFNSLTETTR